MEDVNTVFLDEKIGEGIYVIYPRVCYFITTVLLFCGWYHVGLFFNSYKKTYIEFYRGFWIALIMAAICFHGSTWTASVGEISRSQKPPPPIAMTFVLKDSGEINIQISSVTLCLPLLPPPADPSTSSLPKL